MATETIEENPLTKKDFVTPMTFVGVQVAVITPSSTHYNVRCPNWEFPRRITWL